MSLTTLAITLCVAPLFLLVFFLLRAPVPGERRRLGQNVVYNGYRLIRGVWACWCVVDLALAHWYIFCEATTVAFRRGLKVSDISPHNEISLPPREPERLMGDFRVRADL